MKLLKEREDLKGFLTYNDYDDKELKSKFFKRQIADLSNETESYESYLNKWKLFEQIFDHKTYKISRWTNKYKKNKEKNQIIVNDIHKNKDKLFKKMNLVIG